MTWCAIGGMLVASNTVHEKREKMKNVSVCDGEGFDCEKERERKKIRKWGAKKGMTKRKGEKRDKKEREKNQVLW